MYWWLPWNIWHPRTVVYSPQTIIDHRQQEEKDKACSEPKCDPKRDKGCTKNQGDNQW